MLLMEMPLQAISFEVIAEKARVHKTTLYRRWGTPANLMAEVLNWISSERIPMPDTGSLEGDIRELVALYGEHFRSDLGVTINRILNDHRHTRIDGVDDWMEAHLRRQYESFAEVANRAVRRGGIRSIGEFMFAMELVLGPMLMRSSLNGIPFDRDAEDKWTRVALDYLSLPPAAGHDAAMRQGHDGT